MGVEADARPKSFIETLGPKVEMKTEVMENDEWAQTHLREIGRILTGKQVANGMEYVGSFAFHMVRTTKDHGAMTGQYDLSSITQIAIGEDVSEQQAMLAFNNGALQLRRYFVPSATSGIRGDKR